MARLYQENQFFQPHYCEDFISTQGFVFYIVDHIDITSEIQFAKARKFQWLQLLYFRDNLECVGVDRKYFFDRADLYGKNTRLYAYFCANVYRCINMQGG